MRFISGAPKLIGRGSYGVWQVTAEYSNGEIKKKNYIAGTIAEAKRMYLQEHGGRIGGQLSAEFVRDFIIAFPHLGKKECERVSTLLHSKLI